FSRFVGLLEFFAGVFTDRLEHPVAIARVTHEALVDKRLERVDVRVCDAFRCLERATASEDGEARKELLLLGGQQLVAPLDRRAQRALPLGEIARAAGEQREALLEPLQDLLR